MKEADRDPHEAKKQQRNNKTRDSRSEMVKEHFVEVPDGDGGESLF